jgi:hypothetical protein
MRKKVPMIQYRLPHSRLTAALAIGLLLALAACGSASSPTLPPASSILSRAEQALLKDATFTPTTQRPFLDPSTGMGVLTTTPRRIQTFTGSTSQRQIGRYTDSSGYYVVNPDGPADGIKTCPVDIINNDPDVPLMLLQPDFLDYSQLQGVKVLGSEKILGKATWHLQGSRSVTNPLAMAFQVPETIKEDLWFRQDNAYPSKLVFTITPSAGGQSFETITLLFTKWDTNLTIPAQTSASAAACSGQSG